MQQRVIKIILPSALKKPALDLLETQENTDNLDNNPRPPDRSDSAVE